MKKAGGFFVVIIVFFLTIFSSQGVLAQERQWLILIYANGINDRGLQGFGKDLINQLEKFGSSDKVAVVVKYAALSKNSAGELQFPRDIKTYLIQKDNNPSDITSPVIDTSPQTDMASPFSLRTFMRQNLMKYPARKVALVLWGKGEGYRGLLSDDVSRKKMTIPSLRESLLKITETLGKKLDLMVMDADEMMMAEVVYELRDTAEIIVGTAGKAADPGYYYDMMLQDVLDNPSLSAEELAKSFAAASENPVVCGIRTKNIMMFRQLLDQWTNALLNDPASLKAAAAAMNKAIAFTDLETKELHDYVKKAGEAYPANSPAASAADDLTRFMKKELILAGAASGFDPRTKKIVVNPCMGRCLGLAIYLPEQRYDSAAYEPLSFAAESRWRNFLFKLLEEKQKKSGP